MSNCIKKALYNNNKNNDNNFINYQKIMIKLNYIKSIVLI